MQNYSNTKGKHLTLIERWHNRKPRSGNQIARLLCKVPQTIHHELKWGRVQLKTKTKYSAEVAQAFYDTRRRHCGRPSKFTKVLNALISKVVREKLSLEVFSQAFPSCLFTNAV
ncbi:MAG TPA: helix-turn-helix domain-containing protein [Lactovum miscens]|uniref:helix-turn-helix domain-containing protein n=1 Tax=Lactovum miscens TaxID=190387 RepID=UPI002EDAF5E0